MKRIVLSLLFTAFLGALNVHAQKDVLFTVDGRQQVSAEEFKAVFNKNRDIGDQIDPKTPDEYLALYIDFKLKVLESMDLGMDQRESFLMEFEGYRDQLARPYLTDQASEEDLVKEAYDRMKYDVNAGHIMIALESESTTDTLEAWKKIQQIAKELNSGEESFEVLASRHSEDTYSAEQNGVLGYFTAFGMVYPFESMAYKTEVGKTSAVFRTQFGYHILKVYNKRPARSKIKVAHIMLISNNKSTEQEKANATQSIQEIYQRIQSGSSSFEEMVMQFSQDKTSAERMGVLPEFGINEMVTVFEETAFALNTPGEISKPIQTEFGWHIIKLIEKTPIPTFEEAEKQLRRKIQRDQRASIGRQNLIKKLKREYNYKENESAAKKFISQFTSDVRTGDWIPSEKLLADKSVLASFADQNIESYQLAEYIQNNPGRTSEAYPFEEIYRNFLDTYTQQRLLLFEKDQLPAKYPEYRMLMNEYKEGILLFDLTQDVVWNKSIEDSTGLTEFYEAHKANYRWKTRYSYTQYDCADAKTAKKVAKMVKKGKTQEEILAKYNTESNLVVRVTSKYTEKPDAEVLSLNETQNQSEILEKNSRFVFYHLSKLVPPSDKELSECKGLVAADYQKLLEKNWLDELRAKYPVVIDETVKNKLFNSL